MGENRDAVQKAEMSPREDFSNTVSARGADSGPDNPTSVDKIPTAGICEPVLMSTRNTSLL